MADLDDDDIPNLTESSGDEDSEADESGDDNFSSDEKGGPIFNFIKALGARFTSSDNSETQVSITTSQGDLSKNIKKAIQQGKVIRLNGKESSEENEEPDEELEE